MIEDSAMTPMIPPTARAPLREMKAMEKDVRSSRP